MTGVCNWLRAGLLPEHLLLGPFGRLLILVVIIIFLLCCLRCLRLCTLLTLGLGFRFRCLSLFHLCCGKPWCSVCNAAFENNSRHASQHVHGASKTSGLYDFDRSNSNSASTALGSVNSPAKSSPQAATLTAICEPSCTLFASWKNMRRLFWSLGKICGLTLGLPLRVLASYPESTMYLS